jgi:endonuclease/exonuclease/phosphatase family metal-dependent hydrolase
MSGRIKAFFSMGCFILVTSVAYADTHSLSFMTYNIASLPAFLELQINSDFLRPNLERVEEIANVINGFARPPNVIAFEEAFDPSVRSLLKEKLSALYPYNSGEYGQKLLNAGSGLLLLSQYPILEISFHPYKNAMVGEETLANKGFITAKLQYNDNYFVTVIITHLTAGGAIFKDEQAKYGTTSYRRGVQMGEIHDEIQSVGSRAPSGYENLNYLKSFVMGDLNTALNSERQQKSISTGLSNNGFENGQIKYPGQYALFTILNNTIPANFLEVRDLAKQRGEGKTINPDLLAQATQENKFTGTTAPEILLKNNKTMGSSITRQQAEGKVIDGVFCTRDGYVGDLQTNIVSFNEFTAYPYMMSDHFAVMGQFVFND